MTRSQKNAVEAIRALMEANGNIRMGIEEIKQFSVAEDSCGTVYITAVKGLLNDSGYEFTRCRCDLIVGKRGRTVFHRRHHFHADQIVEVPFRFNSIGLRDAFGANLTLRVLEGMNND